LEFADVIRRRRMVRSFDRRPVPAADVDRLIDLARRAPSAGNTQACAFVVLSGDETARLWDVTLPVERRAGFRWPGLVDAPVVIVPVVRPGAYVDRYGEADKASTGLGEGEAAWPVPYWWVDAGMAVHGLLLGAVDAGLGALFYGLFDHESAALAALGVPDGWRAVGAVALGWPAPTGEAPGRSSTRPRPPLADVIHRGRW
jgi:nitroreductase